MEVQIVSQMLFLTSDSPAVAKRLTGVVFINIPTNGANINSKIRAPRKRKMRFMGERRGKIIMNYGLWIMNQFETDL